MDCTFVAAAAAPVLVVVEGVLGVPLLPPPSNNFFPAGTGGTPAVWGYLAAKTRREGAS